MSETEEPTPSSPTDSNWVPPIILRNKGVPITVYRLENGQLPDVEEGEDRPTRTLHLRFNANMIADLEEAFDGARLQVPIYKEEPLLGEDGQVLLGAEGRPLTNRLLVGREERVFYGQEAFQAALEVRPVTTVRKVLSVASGLTEEEAGLSMIPEENGRYIAKVGVAWSISQGVDPTQAARLLQQGLAAVDKQSAALESQLAKTTAPASE